MKKLFPAIVFISFSLNVIAQNKYNIKDSVSIFQTVVGYPDINEIDTVRCFFQVFDGYKIGFVIIKRYENFTYEYNGHIQHMNTVGFLYSDRKSKVKEIVIHHVEY